MQFNKQDFLFCLIICLITFLSGCDSPKSSELSPIQDQYLNESIALAFLRLKVEIQNTGSTEKGVEILDHTTELLKRQVNILSTENIGEIMDLAKAYSTFSGELLTSKKRGEDLIAQSLRELTLDNTNQFKSILKTYTLDVINAYHHQFLKDYAKFDIIGITVNAGSNLVKYGDSYNAYIGLIAANSALKPEISYKLDDDDTFTNLQIEPYFNQGILHLDKVSPGKHLINIKMELPDGDIIRFLKATHEFYVIK